jgi:acyl dehydratase
MTAIETEALMHSEATKISTGDSFSYEFTFSQKDVDAFVALSGDSNIIHNDATAAAESPIGKMAVPGILTATIFSKVLGTMFPGHGTVYRSQNLDFRRPVLLGVRYVARFKVQEVVPQRHRALIETTVAEEASGEECLRGTAVVINFSRL